MTMQRPFKTGPSAVPPALLADAVRLSDCAWSRDGRALLWLEEQDGHGTLWAATEDGEAPRRLTAGPSVRARVGYGGGAFAVGTEDVVFVADDGRLYRQALTAGHPQPLTLPGVQCAAPVISPDGQWVAYVYEVGEENGLAVVPINGAAWPQLLTRGRDFYLHPAWRPDGGALCWIAWDHPRMPWEGTDLGIAAVACTASGMEVGAPRVVAGGPGESVLQPRWSPDGNHLAYLSDRQGWWQLHLADPQQPDATARCITPHPAEFGGPAWQQGMRWYDWLPDGTGLVAVRQRDGSGALVRVALDGAPPIPLLGEDAGYNEVLQPAAHPTRPHVAAIAAGERTPPRLVTCPVGATQPANGQPREAATPRILRRTGWEQLPADVLASLQPVQWQGEDGESVHGLFAAPASPHAVGTGLPPLVVNVHGGPTGQALRTWRPDVQFFTSRGYAFLDVNHRGSSGYGRPYRERLREQWGIIDAADVLSGVRHVTQQGWADANRCAIRGSSAGGYTVLRTLTLAPDVFRAAICLYGISDLFALVRDTHKFELHYLDSLIGELPQAAERYRERSPLFHAERIATPLLLFQGEADRVVPPTQSEAIVASLRGRGVPHAYHTFAREGHGFRRRETLLRVWSLIEEFLATHLVYG